MTRRPADDAWRALHPDRMTRPDRLAVADALDTAAERWADTHPGATWDQAYAFAELELELEPVDTRPRAQRRRKRAR